MADGKKWHYVRSAQFVRTADENLTGGMCNPETLTLRVDKQEPLRWPHKAPVLINGLDLQDNHLVVLTSDGKRLQSFRFKFSEADDARLCLYYDGYRECSKETRRTPTDAGENQGLLAINPFITDDPSSELFLLAPKRRLRNKSGEAYPRHLSRT